MSLFNYYVVRHSTQALYSFEFVVVVAAWLLVLVLWQRSGDVRPLAAYIIGGLYNSGIELLAIGRGVRTIPEVHLFGAVHVGYPVLPFILGFFEGGVLLLAGFEILRGIMENDRRALRTGLGVTAGLATLIIAGSLLLRVRPGAGPQASDLTVRAVFSGGSLVILAVCYAASLGYVWRVRDATGRARKGLLVWYAAVATVAATWYTPAFLSGSRGIAQLQNGVYVPASLLEQITVLYGYSIVFEAAGFYLPVYIIIRLCRLI